jgi:hypothetical protein
MLPSIQKTPEAAAKIEHPAPTRRTVELPRTPLELTVHSVRSEKTVCPHSKCGHFYSMLTMTYERFCHLSTLSTLFLSMGAKKIRKKTRKTCPPGCCLA